jgi:hypothetical protein
VFLIQLGSFDTLEQATNKWQSLKSSESKLLGKLSFKASEVKIPGGDKLVYRTQAGPVKTRAEAEKICETLGKKQIDCFIVETVLHAPSTLKKEIVKAKPTMDNKAKEVKTETKQVKAASSPKPLLEKSTKKTPLPWATKKESEQITAPIAKVSAKEVKAPTVLVDTTKKPTKDMRAAQSFASTTEVTEVKVAEAIRVPLEDQSRFKAKNLYDPSSFKGFPSQDVNQKSTWAHISIFTNEKSARNFWRQFHNQNRSLSRNLRVRMIKPYINRFGSRKTALRLGPVSNASEVSALCQAAYKLSNKVNCRSITDLGSTAPAVRKRSKRLSSGEQRLYSQRYGYGDISGYHWVQIGTYDSAVEAQTNWENLQGKFPKLLGKATRSITLPALGSNIEPSYRLRVGPYRSRINAAKLCSKLKVRGNYCVVVVNR